MNIVQPRIDPVRKPTPKSLTFDEVSKLFSLPLSDAADSLGVCISVLKKICHDNGLVRWPHRKFLAGKSIEEIKRAALMAKSKEPAETPSNPGERGSETPKQPQGIKNSETGNFQNMNSLNLTKETQTNSDEFKYGFPSDRLSTVSYKWWGNSSVDDKKSNNKSVEEKESQSEDKSCSSLSSIRRRVVKEGEAALKLGVYRGSGVKKVEWNKKSVLIQIFKSSLPNEWEIESPLKA